jgi:DNA mismatch endonuclease (patch repair protein)
MMAGVRSRNTKPEIKVRKALHAQGFRFSRSSLNLAGKPDVVLPKWKVVVFVHGCFWHLHGCHLSKTPASNTGFWIEKLSKNVERDRKVVDKLLEKGWRVLIIWECSMRGKHAEEVFGSKISEVANWIREKSDQKTFVVPNGNGQS